MRHITAELLLFDLLHGQKLPSRLFGELLRQVCHTIGLTQERLECLAREKYGNLIKGGHILPNEQLGSMDQTVISRVMRSQQDPTFAQVYTWISVVVESQALADYRAKYQQNNPDFIKDLEAALWNGTDYKSPQDLAAAYNFAQKFAQAPRMKRQRTERNIDDIHTDCEIDSIKSQSNIEIQKMLQEPQP